jgi:N-acetylglutamate synthase-like GNAT family acetyltransferase
MKAREKPKFESEIGRQIYDFVERSGAVRPTEVDDYVQTNPEEFRHQLALLKRDGYLEEHDGKLRLALETGAAEQYTTGEFDFVIRPAREEDLSGIIGAIRQVAAEKTDIVAESVAEALDQEGALLRHNEQESRVFFVASVDDEVVGWAHLHVPEFEKLRHTAELTVGVLEDYRGHGIGSHLVQRSLQWARSNGLEKVYQSLPATNQDAVNFLEEQGWETEAIRQKHYKIGDDYVAEQMMAYLF